ncbi:MULTISPECIES: hypothetical protein [unclassified Cyanobium]|uniref:hypothetical protein n=1 Tax=unclassified Cyanobium TaxID=2627006 RepID=UPI0020CF2318|nr:MULTISPECIES: hypothetical protein [unclassified Cyanobium]MCP9832731.1 hypothetical protein [Cyanobium sp. La Preciosa 7G6]MCP9935482.1 hypothetical protein [Cyanobium sp. Aljojuca 7A6]
MSVSGTETKRHGGLLLVGLGLRRELEGLAPLAARLAAAEAMALRQLARAKDPDASLAALTNEATGPWLAALPLDPGLPLARGGSWAEALGAWRQPCLLVMRGEQMATGLPAAGAALLAQWRVPLAGLVQMGGDWQPLKRRRDGLPWLGWLPDAGEASGEGEAAMAALQQVLRSRWRVLQAA